MGLVSLRYRRPEYVDKEEFLRSYTSISENDTSNPSLKSGHSGPPSGIPDALTFDRIINGGTCPPCTVRDFMNYLIYIEHAAENLQFFLWYRDYIKRFNEINISEAQLSPEWTQTMEDEAMAKIHKDAVDKIRKEPNVAVIFRGTDFEKGASDTVVEIKDPFSTPPSTPSLNDTLSTFSGSQLYNHQVQAQDAFSAAGATQPFTIQPFRAELNRVITTYLASSSPRQLNLSSREQKTALLALSRTTHPSALRPVARAVEAALRRQAHPNFVRWSICNGNAARGTFARYLGAALVGGATLAAMLVTMSGAGRGWRAVCAVGWVLGIATSVAAGKGMCVVLHGLHHRHVRPWELFEDVSSPSPASSFDESELEERGGVGGNGGNGGNARFDAFGPRNSYEDEPWVVRYERRGVVRRVFDREVWVREPALRRIQDVIFAQSVLAALLGAAVLTAVFVSVPAGGFF